MNIVMEKQINGRLQDGINAILNLSEKDFNKLINMILFNLENKINDTIYLFYSTDKCKNPNKEIKLGLSENNERQYVCYNSLYNIKDIISELEIYTHSLEKTSEEYLRCQKIIQTRNLEAFKRFYSGKNGEKSELVNKLFEVLTDSEIFNKFINYENNIDYFSINGKQQKIEDYLKIFGEIFDYKDEFEGKENAFFPGMLFMQNFFNIPKEIYDMINKNATTLYDKYHKEYVRYVDQRYEFKSLFGINDTRIIRKVDEPDWNINKELTEAVYKDMPQDLSIEEKALYIYIKLCQELEYNEEYFYRNKGITDQFNSDFSQEYLESIKPRTKITCFDFARILSKFLNELNGDIESVIISFGINRGHFSTGFYTDNISVKLEPININLNGKKDPTNDLMKAKNGIKLKGIQPMFDKDEIVESSLNKVYSLIYGKDALSIKDFLNELKTIPKEEIRDNFKLKLQSFIEIMKERKKNHRK